MLQALLNIFKIVELRNKIFFTIGMLAVFRIGHWIPLPGVNQEQLREAMEKQQSEGSAAAGALNVIAMLSGGAFSHSTIFGLGVAPYISASIIFQLLQTVLPKLKKLQEEGPTGRQKIQEWTRYATIVLAIFQAIGYLKFTESQNMIYSQWASSPAWWFMAVTALTAGTVFLMWLAEQIEKYGIGNGISMLIMAGIVASMPAAVQQVSAGYTAGTIPPLAIIILFALFTSVVAGSVVLTVAQRRIAVQQAKHTRGRKVYGGQRSYLPLRVNHAGVMPVIFASSLLIFPSMILASVVSAVAPTGSDATGVFAQSLIWLNEQMTFGNFLYIVGEVILIYFFSYFWITVQFNPEEMSKQLREHGSFVPGLRPGPRTAEYLEAVMERITFVGAGFLALIAVLPMVISAGFQINQQITQFLGGTGLLITVSVMLDVMQRIEANLLMRNYAGFLSNADGKGARLPGPRAL